MGAAGTDRDLTALLERSGLGRVASVARMRAGGNNRVFLAETERGRFVAKQYFRSTQDTRDRLNAEWSFLGYVGSLGLRCTPRSIAVHRDAGVAIYEHVEGRRPEASEIGMAQVSAAAEFFLGLNGPDRHRLGAALGPASEACFSLRAHLDLVGRRIGRLAGIAPTTPVDREAAALVTELRGDWERVGRNLEVASGSAIDLELPVGQRCISPSDFGFHNALIRRDGSVCFLDFEYAGWDDPAKMAADFFCQPAVPVSDRHFDAFVAKAMSFADNPEMLEARARALLPVIRIKWSCIMLNQFLPESAMRRSFADPEANSDASKRAQLDKVWGARAQFKMNAG
jgi:hypothetical protein